YNITTSTTEFTGWLEPWNASHPYQAPGYEVEMVATCGLGRLQLITYPLTSGTSSIRTGIEIVQKCLAQLDNGIQTHVSIHTKPIGGVADTEVLKMVMFDETRWFEGSSPLKCSQILQDVLVRFNAKIFQEDNAWKIQSITDKARGYNGYRVYRQGSTTAILNVISSSNYFELNKEDLFDSDGGTIGVGRISVEPPINKWVVEADLSPRKQVIFNGDLRYWDGTTFPGWT